MHPTTIITKGTNQVQRNGESLWFLHLCVRDTIKKTNTSVIGLNICVVGTQFNTQGIQASQSNLMAMTFLKAVYTRANGVESPGILHRRADKMQFVLVRLSSLYVC